MPETLSVPPGASPRKPVIAESDVELVRRFLELVSGHVSDLQFSIEMYASEMCMSRSNLFAHLSVSTGMSAGAIVNDVRMYMSKLLLATTGKDVLEISSMLGFAEMSSFCCKFRKEVGMTATQYRAGCQTGSIGLGIRPEVIYTLTLVDGRKLELDLKPVMERMT